VYSFNGRNPAGPPLRRLDLITHSDKVWVQGPKGGVKLVKSRNSISRYGYVTRNEQAMQEFAWIKLSAIHLA
jgi:hypothetical protein